MVWTPPGKLNPSTGLTGGGHLQVPVAVVADLELQCPVAEDADTAERQTGGRQGDHGRVYRQGHRMASSPFTTSLELMVRSLSAPEREVLRVEPECTTCAPPGATVPEAGANDSQVTPEPPDEMGAVDTASCAPPDSAMTLSLGESSLTWTVRLASSNR